LYLNPEVAIESLLRIERARGHSSQQAQGFSAGFTSRPCRTANKEQR
jgi:hypothetical protein